MTPTDYAAAELALWEQSLREQQRAEEELTAARWGRRRKRIIELMSQVEVLRTRADLLLAEAVKVKCAFRHQRSKSAWVSTTVPGMTPNGT